jgi:hypothetical protein
MENLEEKEKFLDAYNQKEKLNQDHVSHINRTITSNEIEAVVKSIPTKKSLGPEGFIVKFYQIFKEELIPILPFFLQK